MSTIKVSGTAVVVGVGAERGLGAALCRRFAAEGYHVKPFSAALLSIALWVLALCQVHRQYRWRAIVWVLSPANLYRKEPFYGSFFQRRLFVGCPPCLRASAPSPDVFRLKHGNI